MSHLAERALAEPMYQEAYRFVPTRMAMVELDRAGRIPEVHQPWLCGGSQDLLA
jgi:hypothetical protein